jgi:NitT/TauT family transport system substrate-binding protein
VKDHPRSEHSRGRRALLRSLPALAALSLPSLQAQPAAPLKRARLVLAGPMASVSNPLIRIAESGALSDLADKVEFVTWSNPDQLRALAMEGKADFIAVPANVAANLYNRGIPLVLLNVSVWGMLWMVSRRPDLNTLADFKGQEIAIPFRADMPDILFQLLAEKQGLDVRRDFRIRYVASPVDAMQLLVMRQVDHALLSEPAVSMALRKSQSGPVGLIAPKLHRSVSLQEEWGRLLRQPPLIPQAGIAALGAARLDPVLVTRLQAAYAGAQDWCQRNADACGAMVAKRIEMLSPEAVADGIRAAPRHFASAAKARPELEYFYRLLLEREPALVGGRLPDAAFYGGAAG